MKKFTLVLHTATISKLFLLLLLTLAAATTQAQLTVTINKEPGQSVLPGQPALFDVVFSQPINVATFTAADISLGGTATGQVVNSIVQIAPNDGTTFQVSITSTTGVNGQTIIPTIPAATISYGQTALYSSFNTNVEANVVTDNAGNFYTITLSSSPAALIKIDPATGTITTIAALPGGGTAGYNVTNLAIDAAGNFYIDGAMGPGYVNGIYKVTPAGVVSLFCAMPAWYDTDEKLIVDAAGNLWGTAENISIADTTVIKVNSSGTLVGAYNYSGYGIAVNNATGNVYITHQGVATEEVLELNSSGTLLNTFVLPGTASVDGQGNLAIDAGGNVYTYAPTNGKLYKITPGGIVSVFASFFGDTFIVSSRATSVDAMGNVLLVAPASNSLAIDSLYMITPSGAVTSIDKVVHAETYSAVNSSCGDIYISAATVHNNKLFSPVVATGIAAAATCQLAQTGNAASTSTDNVISLPVILTSFTATEANCTANLQWITSTEENNSAYQIQQSTDAANFATIGTVTSKNNSNSTNYNYTVNNLAEGVNYFRLKMIDKDGSYAYSPIAHVQNSCNAGKIIAAPNPAGDNVTISGLKGNNTLALLSADGRRISKVQSSGFSQQINLQGLVKGLYLISVIAPDGTVTNLKVIKE